jgi:small-conductance mechanosensitive channel
MLRLISGLILVVCLAAAGAVRSAVPAQTAEQSARAEAAPTASDAAEVQATKADIARMRVVLNQMRTNLAFVTTTTNPLKHQFELDIDMWQAVIDQMQRRVDAAERGK